MRNKTILFTSLLVTPFSIYGVDYSATISNETRWESNVFQNATENDDVVNRLKAEVDLRHQEGLIAAQANVFGTLTRYLDLTDENSEDFGVSAGLTLPSVEEQYPYKIDLNGGFSRTSSPDDQLGQIVEADVFEGAFGLEYEIIPRYGLKFELDASDNEFNLNTTSDFTTFGFTLGGFYDYSEKLRLTSGYKFLKTDVDGAGSASSDTHTLYVGAEGNLFARSTGRVEVGGTYRDYENNQFDSDTSFFADIGFTWEGSELWALDVLLSNFFDTGANNQSKLVSNATVTLVGTPSSKLTWTTSLFASNYNYEGNAATNVGPAGSEDREDQVYGASASITHFFTVQLSATLDVAHSIRESDFALFDYSDSTIGAKIAYTF